MSDSIDIKFLTGKAQEIAQNNDKYDVNGNNTPDSKLSGAEISVFLADCEKEGINIEKEPWYAQFTNIIEDVRSKINSTISETTEVKQEITSAETTPLAKDSDGIKDMRANIAREAQSHGTELTEEQIEKWNDVILKEAKLYNIPPEVLIVIISIECSFSDPQNNKNGCMQVMPSTVNDIKQDRWEIYANTNNTCRNDTINNLKTHNLTDRSTSIKAGILVFQTKYAEAVARTRGWKIGKQPDIAKAVRELKKGNVNLSPTEAKKVMRMALRDYNGSSHKEKYAADCIKRLDDMEYDYTRTIFS